MRVIFRKHLANEPDLEATVATWDERRARKCEPLRALRQVSVMLAPRGAVSRAQQRSAVKSPPELRSVRKSVEFRLSPRIRGAPAGSAPPSETVRVARPRIFPITARAKPIESACTW